MKARLPQGYGAGAPNNMNTLARQAQKMQEEMARITEECDAKEYEASVGGSAVSVVVNGKLEVKSIQIKPEVVDPEDIDMLTDLLTAAVNEAIRKAGDDKSGKLESVTGGLSMPGMF